MFSQHELSSNFSLSDFTENERRCIMEEANENQQANFENNQGSNSRDTQNEMGQPDSYSAWKLRNKIYTKNTTGDSQMSGYSQKEQSQNHNFPINRPEGGPSITSRYQSCNSRGNDTDSESENFSFYPDQHEDTTSQYLHFVETSLQEKYKSSQRQNMPTKEPIVSNTQYSPSQNTVVSTNTRYPPKGNTGQSATPKTNSESPKPQKTTNASLPNKSNSPHNYNDTSQKSFTGSQSTPVQHQAKLLRQQTLRTNSTLNSEQPFLTERCLQTGMASTYREQPVQGRFYSSNTNDSFPMRQGSPTGNAIFNYNSQGVNGHSTLNGPNYTNSCLQGNMCFAAGCACEKKISCNPLMHCSVHQVRNTAQDMCSNTIMQNSNTHHFSGNFEKNLQELLEKHSKQLNVLETLTIKILQELAVNKECRSCVNRKEEVPKSYLHLVDTGTQTTTKDYVSVGIETSPVKSCHNCIRTVPDSEKHIVRNSSEVHTNTKSFDLPSFSENCCIKEVSPCEKGTCHENSPAPRYENSPAPRHENSPAPRHENSPVPCCVNSQKQGPSKENTEGNAVGWTFYKNVMGEANKLLYEQSSVDQPMKVNRQTVEEVRHATLRNIQNFGIDVREPNLPVTEPSPKKVTFNPACYPQLGIPSVMNNAKSESSLRINALAMKYLEDDQLRELHLTTGHDMAVYNVSATNVSTASTNISVATLQYLQRYHLLPHTGLPTGPIIQPAPAVATRGNVAVHSPEHVNSGEHVPSRILDITALKQQPKLL